MAQRSTSAKPKILIVEDEGLIARDIATRVRRAGYDVAGIAGSGEEAFEQATVTSPDLILMDIRLNGNIDGIEAARRIQEHYDLPIIYLTAHTDRETLDRAKTTGAFGFLAKPIGQGSLPSSIEIALFKHKAERKLRQQRAWLETTLHTISDAVIVTDHLGRIHYMNPAAERITRWPSNEAHAAPLSHVLKLFHPEYGQWLAGFFTAIEPDVKTQIIPAGLKLITRTGEQISIEGEMAPSTQDGTSLGSVITFRDITRREHEEQELRHEHKMEAVGRLAAGVAHDFNNLLTVILGHASLLLHDPARLDEPVAHAMNEITQAATAAAAITKQLLTFSRHQTTNPELVNLNTVIKDNEERWRSTAAGITWKTSLDPQLKPLCADPAQMVHVLKNLVANAADAMPAGGVLTVTTENVEMGQFSDVGSDVQDHVVLTISDTGVGMEPSVAEHIFEPFFTTKAENSGTGLGLSIVYNIVNDLGGVISVESKPGAGSTFRVFLPAGGQSARKPDEPACDSRLWQDEPKTILLVDDNDAVRHVVYRYLDSHGYRVLEAANGYDALTIASTYSGHIDALVTDVIMPKMNGFHLAEQLTQLRPDLQTIFVSGYAHDVIHQKSDIMKDALFLQKPFLHSDLLEQLDRLFNANRPAAEAASWIV